MNQHDLGRPIFLLATSPRSGSTWVQRMMIGAGALIWGERFALNICKGLEEAQYWQTTEDEDHVRGIREFAEKGPNMWTAVLQPNPTRVWMGLEAMLTTSLGKAAWGLGYGRWGVKETMWRPKDAMLLSCAFQFHTGTKWVFLVRDPKLAFISRYSGYGLPDPVGPDMEWFLWLWKHNTTMALLWTSDEFRDSRSASLYRYEDLLESASLRIDLMKWLGLDDTKDPNDVELIGGSIGASDHRHLEPPEQEKWDNRPTQMDDLWKQVCEKAHRLEE